MIDLHLSFYVRTYNQPAKTLSAVVLYDAARLPELPKIFPWGYIDYFTEGYQQLMLKNFTQFLIPEIIYDGTVLPLLAGGDVAIQDTLQLIHIDYDAFVPAGMKYEEDNVMLNAILLVYQDATLPISRAVPVPGKTDAPAPNYGGVPGDEIIIYDGLYPRASVDSWRTILSQVEKAGGGETWFETRCHPSLLGYIPDEFRGFFTPDGISGMFHAGETWEEFLLMQDGRYPYASPFALACQAIQNVQPVWVDIDYASTPEGYDLCRMPGWYPGQIGYDVSWLKGRVFACPGGGDIRESEGSDDSPVPPLPVPIIPVLVRDAIVNISSAASSVWLPRFLAYGEDSRLLYGEDVLEYGN